MINPFNDILLPKNTFEDIPALNKYISDIFGNLEYFRRDPIGLVEINRKILQLKLVTAKSLNTLDIRRVADRVVEYVKSDEIIPETELIKELNLKEDIEIIHSNHEQIIELEDKLELVENILIQDLMHKEELIYFCGLKYEKRRLSALVSNGEMSIIDYDKEIAVAKIKRRYFDEIKEIRLKKLRKEINWSEMESEIYLYTKIASRKN